MAKKTTKKVLPQAIPTTENAPQGINLLYVVLGVVFILGLLFLLRNLMPNRGPSNQERTPVVVVDGKVNFETVAKSQNSGFGERVFYTINNEAEWTELWNKMHAVVNPVPELPKVDFEKELLVVAFQGTKNTGGNAIDITDIEKKDGIVLVTVKDSSPGAGCFTTQATTSPYHIVKLPKTSDKFEYDIKYEKVDCAR